MEWYWFALISAVLSAGAAVLQKKVLFDVEPLKFSLIISALTSLISIPLIALVKFESITPLPLMILFGKSMLNALAFLFVMTALKHLDISRALPVMAAAPMLIALLAFIFLGESLKAEEVAGIALISIGTFGLELKKGEGLMQPLRVLANSHYHKYLFGALLLISVSSVLDRALLGKFKVPPLTFLVFQNFFFFILFVIIALSRKQLKSMLTIDTKQTAVIFILIAVITVLYRLAQFEATSLAPVGPVIAIKRLSVLFAAVAGSRIFREEDFFRRITATVLITAGAMLIFRD